MPKEEGWKIKWLKFSWVSWVVEFLKLIPCGSSIIEQLEAWKKIPNHSANTANLLYLPETYPGQFLVGFWQLHC